MTLSPSDLAKKLKEVGLPKTLKQCLEGKDCVEWYFALLLIIYQSCNFAPFLRQ